MEPPRSLQQRKLDTLGRLESDADVGGIRVSPDGTTWTWGSARVR
jgi:hypothetical protein